MLAEEVLLSVLEARPVEVSDIRGALSHLRAEQGRPAARTTVLEKIAVQAAAIVEAESEFSDACDAPDGDPDPEAIWDAIGELRLLLTELARV